MTGATVSTKSVRINDAIRANELRVIGESGEQLGVMTRGDAIKAAEEAGLDLVEISPAASPPVAKIVDWGKYQYQKMKELQKSRQKSRQSELKQMRLGLKIGQNDLDIKLRKIREFLSEGDKVRISIVFRGREMAHQELGFQMMDRITEKLSEEAIVENRPQMAGRNLSVTVRSK